MEGLAEDTSMEATLARPGNCMTCELKGALGLHARPAALIARAARGFAADITVALESRRADAKSVLALLTLGAPHGAELRVTAEGRDAPEALHALERLLASDLDGMW